MRTANLFLCFILATTFPAAIVPAANDDHDAQHDDHDHDEHADHDDHGADAHDEHDDHHDDDHGDEHGHADEVRLTPEAIRRHGIIVEPVRRHVLSETFTAPARVSFDTEAMAHVGSALEGRIVEMKVKLGQTVKAGDELLVIESPQLAEAQSDYLLKRAETTVAETAVEPARLAYERARGLHETSEGIALAEVQKRQADWHAAQGRAVAAEAGAEAAENKLHVLGMSRQAIEELARTGKASPRSSVYAPISGQVIEREVTLGELVGPERDALLVLADLSTLWVVADVPEARLGSVSIGSPARVHVTAQPQQPALNGMVTYVSPSLNPDTRAAAVRIEVPHREGLRPGMFARAQIAAEPIDDHAEEILAVPEEAVQSIEGQPAVFVPVDGEPNTFSKRTVKVGSVVGGMVPIFDGLKEGEPIVTANTFILKADLGKSGAAHEH